MEEVYDFILDNIYLFCILMALFFAIIVFIIYMMKISHKKHEIKEEVIEDNTLKSREELESITDDEIEKRIEENYKEEKNEKEEVTTDIEELISSMKKKEPTDPSEALKKFEEEQEDQAIISYQQLVDSVKNNKIETYDDEIQYKQNEDSLSKFNNYELEIDEEPINDTSLEINNLNNLINSFEEKIEEKNKENFKPNEFISPVFGRMDISNVKYREGLEYTDKKEKKNNVLEEIPLSKKNEPLIQKPVYKEAKKLDSEEFLRNLKEFRKNL